MRGAPGIDGRNLVHAGHGAARGAGFFGEELAVALLVSVFHDGNARIAALLRTIVDQAVFADVEIARASTAAPVVFLAARDIVLELIDTSEGLLFQRDNFFENFLLAWVQGLELAVVIVENADGGGESQSDGAMRDCRTVGANPSGQGFEAAASELGGLYVVRGLDQDGQATAGRRITFEIKFQVPRP